MLLNKYNTEKLQNLHDTLSIHLGMTQYTLEDLANVIVRSYLDGEDFVSILSAGKLNISSREILRYRELMLGKEQDINGILQQITYLSSCNENIKSFIALICNDSLDINYRETLISNVLEHLRHLYDCQQYPVMDKGTKKLLVKLCLMKLIYVRRRDTNASTV